MTVSIYQIHITAAVATMEASLKILDKAAAFCAERNIEPSILLAYRLAPNMWPFSRQIQAMADRSRRLVAKLLGEEEPPWPNTESSFDELKTRVTKTISLIKSIDPSRFEGVEDRDITLNLPTGDVTIKGLRFANTVGLPNVFFHSVTAYDILRHAGVALGKRDFLGI
jgi:hypothetical protein